MHFSCRTTFLAAHRLLFYCVMPAPRTRFQTTSSSTNKNAGYTSGGSYGVMSTTNTRRRRKLNKMPNQSATLPRNYRNTAIIHQKV